MTQVFNIEDVAPTKEDADSDNKVNWFHPQFGWAQGHWEFPCYTDVTHWAHLPERPAAVDQEERINTAFNTWIGTFPDAFDPSAVSLLKTGFRAGFRKAKAFRA